MDTSSTEQQHQVSSHNVGLRQVVSEPLLRVNLFSPAEFYMVVGSQRLMGSSLSNLALGLDILALLEFCCLSSEVVQKSFSLLHMNVLLDPMTNVFLF